MDKGYIHLYTGNGKGKTTAAFGLAVRAACAGKSVYIGQFVKDMEYSETRISGYIPLIKVEQLGKGCFITEAPTEMDKEVAEQSLEKCGKLLKDGSYDVIILDEITIALYYKLLDEASVIEAVKNRAQHVEVVMTGRYAPDSLIELSDLVTEMKEIKHYYTQNVLSREGIDC